MNSKILPGNYNIDDVSQINLNQKYPTAVLAEQRSKQQLSRQSKQQEQLYEGQTKIKQFQQDGCCSKQYKVIDQIIGIDTGQQGKIVFFVLVGWILQFVLAQKDTSLCLEVAIIQSFTFRTWLLVDGATTLFIGVMFCIFYNVHKCYWNTLQAYKSFFQLFIMIPCAIFKVGWIWFGIGVYLNLINFPDCSSNTVSFMSAYFISFFYISCLIVFKIISKVIKKVEKCIPIEDDRQRLADRMELRNNSFKKIHSLCKQIKRQIENIDDVRKDEEDERQQELNSKYKSNKAYLGLKEKREKLDQDFDSIKNTIQQLLATTPSDQELIKTYKQKPAQLQSHQQALDAIQNQNQSQFVFFFIVGWCLEFILAQKDPSVCLQTSLSSPIAFTFRTWLWIDGGTTLFISIQLKLEQFLKHCVFKCFFFIARVVTFTFKFIWILLGIGIYLHDVNFADCSSNTIAFMNLYFIGFGYTILLFIFYRLPRFKQLVMKRYREAMKSCYQDQNQI